MEAGLSIENDFLRKRQVYCPCMSVRTVASSSSPYPMESIAGCQVASSLKSRSFQAVDGEEASVRPWRQLQPAAEAGNSGGVDWRSTGNPALRQDAGLSEGRFG